jgi:hypothetical protein
MSTLKGIWVRLDHALVGDVHKALQIQRLCSVKLLNYHCNSYMFVKFARFRIPARILEMLNQISTYVASGSVYLVGDDEGDGLDCVFEVWCEIILAKV